MRRSIFKQMIAVFLAAILLTSLVVGFFSYVYSSRATVARSSQYARAGATAAAQIIEAVDLEDLKSSETSALYAQTRALLKKLCQDMGLVYLYLYEADQEARQARFIMTVSSDDLRDADVALKRGLGVVIPLDLTEQEQAALRGEEIPDAYIMHNEFGDVYSWYCPVRDRTGRPVALIGSDYSSALLHEQAFQGTVVIIVSMIAALLSVFSVTLVFMRKRIFIPIRLISGRMRDFVADGGTELEPLRVNSQDEMREIADAFEKMSGDIRQYLKDIERMTTERVQKSVELTVAGRIQSGIVPSETRLSDTGYEIYACARPAKVVGGDFYDCFKLPDGRVCIVIGDVSGKGIAAAMFMSMVKTMIHDMIQQGMTPAAALDYVNDVLCRSNPEGMFATVFAAVLDTDGGTLSYANAGHTKPLILGPGGGFLEPDPGVAIGLFEDANIIDAAITLQEDAGILLYTDGITESIDPQRRFFGSARLQRAVRQASGAGQAARLVHDAVLDFTDGTEQFDDYTLLILYYRGGAVSRYSLKPELSSLPRLRALVREAAGSGPRGRQINLACEEIFVNIATHSNATECEISLASGENCLCVTICDDGIPFDPVRAPGAEKGFDDFDAGGMGISLVKQISDTMDYRREGSRNMLTLEFSISGQTGKGPDDVL